MVDSGARLRRSISSRGVAGVHGNDGTGDESRVLDFPDDPLQLLLPPCGEYDTRTLPGERLRRGLADPRARACDQRDLSPKPGCHISIAHGGEHSSAGTDLIYLVLNPKFRPKRCPIRAIITLFF
jgi:hypothetical protein